nr:MBL fold metallo-hydrolase [Octadecabacter dasysiphoniae]
MFPNSAWVPALEKFIIARGRLKSVRLKVRYGVILHPEHGPVLIDTGYTSHALIGSRRSAALRLYSRILGPVLNPVGQPTAVLAALGCKPEDVKTIIVTHFHADHVSGLRDFPNARFVVDGDAWAHVSSASAVANLRHGVFDELLPDDFKDRMVPLGSCPDTAMGRDVFGDGSLITVALPGHAVGHFGVWINTAPRPVFYAVDAQWLRKAAVEHRTVGYPARLIMDDFGAYKRSSDLVAQQIAQGKDVVFCHDPEDGPFDYQGPPE